MKIQSFGFHLGVKYCIDPDLVTMPIGFCFNF
jgi:hypothetical protein